jgi:Flp pilus assembly protein TadD
MRASVAAALAVALAWTTSVAAYEAIRTPTTHYHYDVALAALEEQAYERAIDNLKLVVRDEPRNADAHDWLGHAYAALAQRDLARRHLREAIRLDPRHARAHRHLGELQLAENDVKRARETLAALRRLCGGSCEDAVALERALEGRP